MMELIREKKYAFRKRLRVVHKKNIRNHSLTPRNDEYEIKSGLSIVLPENPGEVILCAAKDFVDYLFTSQNVSSMLSYEKNDASDICLNLDASIGEDYIISFCDHIEIVAKNERALSQALYYLEDKMSIRKAPFIKREEIRHTFMFSPRMIHSGYALDEFPDEHLSAITHAGMDAILVFVKDINLTPKGFVDFNELIDRAAKYGIDVYAYSYLKSSMHPSDDGAQEFYDNLYGRLFECCPGFRGVILVGESVEFPSKDEHVADISAEGEKVYMPDAKPRPGWWPCCDYPLWLDCVKKAIRKHRADADIVFWTYNWGYVNSEDRIRLINSLPTDISLMATFEMFETYQHGSFKQTVADYSIAFSGPGKYFLSEAKAAKERGIRLYSMTNTGGRTWDIGTIPYEPVPYQWIERYKGIREAHEKYGLCGLMDSHHFGLWPSFISDLAKQCFILENTSFKDNLSGVIQKHFGDDNQESIDEALRLFSEAIRAYTPSDADQYGAFRLGPAYPFNLIEEAKPAAESYAHFGNRIAVYNYPAEYMPNSPVDCGRGRTMYPALRIRGELESLEKMLAFMNRGVEILKDIKNPSEELLYLTNLGEYISCCIKTGIHMKEWFLISSKLKIAESRCELLSLIEEAKALLLKEKANAESAIPLVERDSCLGWEPSMDYLGDSEHIRWKLRHIDYVINSELGVYAGAASDKWFE